jgi:DNA modification methylase
MKGYAMPENQVKPKELNVEKVCERETVTASSVVRKGDLQNLPQVHPELLGMLPPDSEAYSVLEKMIIEEGAITNPLITCVIDDSEWLLDGHMRLGVATKHKIANFSIKCLSHVNCLEDAMLWMIQNACSHRKLNKAQRAELALKLKTKIQDMAKKNQQLGGKVKEAFGKKPKAHTLEKLAEISGTSPKFIKAVEYVLDNGTPEEKKSLLEKGFGATNLRDKIESRNRKPKPPIEVVPCINPKEGDYIDRIINGNCIQVLKDMHFHGIKDIGTLITSIPYNVGMEYLNYSDSLPYDEYLELIAQAIYLSQKLGRDGMKICINCMDTFNREETKEAGDYLHDIGKDLGNKIDELNKKYDDCNLRFLGRFLWFKNHTNAPLYLGSTKAPVIKNDSEYILVWTKNTRKLDNISGVDCDPGSGVFSSYLKDKYVLTQQEYMEWTKQTWVISACTDKRLLDNHCCPFNPEIPHRLIKLFTNPHDIVLDPFAGISVTGLEAKKLFRKFICIEQSSNYCNFAKELLNEVEKAA